MKHSYAISALLLLTLLQVALLQSCLLSDYQPTDDGIYKNDSYLAVKNVVNKDKKSYQLGDSKRTIHTVKYKVSTGESRILLVVSRDDPKVCTEANHNLHVYKIKYSEPIVHQFDKHKYSLFSKEEMGKHFTVSSLNGNIKESFGFAHPSFFFSSPKLIAVKDFTDGLYFTFQEKDTNSFSKEVNAKFNKIKYDIKDYLTVSYEVALKPFTTLNAERIYIDAGYPFMNFLLLADSKEDFIMNYIYNNKESKEFTAPYEIMLKAHFVVEFYNKLNKELKSHCKDKLLSPSQILTKYTLFKKLDNGTFNVTAPLYRGALIKSELPKGAIVRNSKFLSTSLSKEVAYEFSQSKMSRMAYKFIGDDNCPLQVSCFECRRISLGTEAEVLLVDDVYFIFDGIEPDAGNKITLIKLKSYCGPIDKTKEYEIVK